MSGVPPSDAEFIVYPDGASRKDGRGGWGFCIWWDGEWWDEFGGQYDTTNGRMELAAATYALQLLDGMAEKGERLTIEMRPDAKYVMDGATDYLPDWKFRNWRTAANKPVKHVDLWEIMDRLLKKHDVTWTHVKGHSGVEGNERADKLATAGVPPAREQPQTVVQPKRKRKPTWTY